MKYIPVYLFQRFPAYIIIAVAGGSGKTRGCHPVFLHGMQYLGLVVLSNFINGLEAFRKPSQNFLAVLIYLAGNAHFFVLFQ